MEITIAHLYPDLLNLYGDRGNIITLERRLEARGITANTVSYELSDKIDFSGTDIVFVGGGSDREQQLVCGRMCEMKNELKSYAEDGGTIVAVCGGYQLLGDYYQLESEKIPGTGLLDIYTEQGKGRLIGNVVLESEYVGSTIVGFENHGGRTYIGSHTPLGKVLYGNGNDDKSGYEGVVYKNVVATYLHGPLLPKNPILADKILKNAVERKYGNADFADIDDTLETQAHEYIVNRFVKKAE